MEFFNNITDEKICDNVNIALSLIDPNQSKTIRDEFCTFMKTKQSLKLLYVMTQIKNGDIIRENQPITHMMCEEFLIKNIFGQLYLSIGNSFRCFAKKVNACERFYVADDETFALIGDNKKILPLTIMSIARQLYTKAIMCGNYNGYIGLGLTYSPYSVLEREHDTISQNIDFADRCEAKKNFENALQMDVPESYKYLAWMSQNTQDKIMYLRKAQELNVCGRHASHAFLGWCLDKIGRHKEAREEYEKGIIRNEISSYSAAGNIYFEERNLKQCELILRRMSDKIENGEIINRPNNTDWIVNLRNIYLILKMLYTLIQDTTNDKSVILADLINEYNFKVEHCFNIGDDVKPTYIHHDILYCK